MGEGGRSHGGLPVIDVDEREAVAGFVLVVGIWLFCQSAGALITGQATDPNTGPIIAVMAVAVFGIRESLRRVLTGKDPRARLLVVEDRAS